MKRLITAGAIAVTILGARVHGVSAGQTHAAATAKHVVAAGETLWSIAGSVAPHTDRRDTVDRILHFNHLRSPVLYSGQILQIPPR